MKIPIAQSTALIQFCLDQINKTLQFNNISIDDNKGKRFANFFIGSIALKLDTPRLAVRYSNTISFSLPLLYKEVNTVDLMLIEALRVFYPLFYDLIKSNPHLFLDSYFKVISNEKDKNKVKILEYNYENLSKDLTQRQRYGVQSLLNELFPRLHQVSNNSLSIENDESFWYKDKRLCSSRYFNRYFSYVVIKGELSDIAFEEMMSYVTFHDESKTIEALTDLINTSSTDSLAYKLRSVEGNITWDASSKLAKAISKCSELFPGMKGDSFMGSVSSPNSQVRTFINQIIKNHENKDEGLALAKYLIEDAQPFDFACELSILLRSGSTNKNLSFTNDQNKELAGVILKRALKEAGDVPLFEKFPENTKYLFAMWAENDKEGFDNYIIQSLKDKPDKCSKLLIAYTPTHYSSAYPVPHKTDFSRDEYNYLVTVIDKNLILDCISKTYKEEDIGALDIKWDDQKGEYQSDLNIVKQFIKCDRNIE